jgi:methionyl-tRNA synthetase
LSALHAFGFWLCGVLKRCSIIHILITKNKFYLTTSIAYVNGAPHIGYALELAQADAVARWRRAQGDEVYFLTGTDEHGAKIARAADAAGIAPQALADANAAQFKALRGAMNVSWDEFIRTTDQERHWPNVERVWRALAAAGDIYKKTYRGLYCVGHEAFVTEKDLEGGMCRDHGAAPEAIEEENYFFRLSKYAPEVKRLIESGALRIVPEGRAKEIMNFIDQGIEDISFSRPRKDLAWGIPVPGDDTQTIYVWCDALVNYLAPAEWWPASVHMIGKDILRFHALYWPAMLLSARIELPKTIFVHGHITSGGQKMSKTLGNVISPAAIAEAYGADAMRYFLLKEIPATDDGDFTMERFQAVYASDLVNGIGNFAARTGALMKRHGMSAQECVAGGAARAACENAKKSRDERMAAYEINHAAGAVMDLISFGDRYLNAEKPWDKNAEGEQAKGAVRNAGAVLLAAAELIAPFLPATSEKIFRGETGMLFPRLEQKT